MAVARLLELAKIAIDIEVSSRASKMEKNMAHKGRIAHFVRSRELQRVAINCNHTMAPHTFGLAEIARAFYVPGLVRALDEKRSGDGLMRTLNESVIEHQILALLARLLRCWRESLLPPDDHGERVFKLLSSMPVRFLYREAVKLGRWYGQMVLRKADKRSSRRCVRYHQARRGNSRMPWLENWSENGVLAGERRRGHVSSLGNMSGGFTGVRFGMAPQDN